MSYATIALVKSMFRDFASNTQAAVTDDDITVFLNDAEVMINSRIATLYSMPITVGANPEAFKVLTMIEKYLAADVVDGILNNYSEANLAPEWGKKAVKMLKELIPPLTSKGVQPEPVMKLIDATYLGTSTQRGKLSLSATTGRQFEKGGDNW